MNRRNGPIKRIRRVPSIESLEARRLLTTTPTGITENFESGVLDPHITFTSVGTFNMPPSIQDITNFGGTKAFGFGLSTAAVNAFYGYQTSLTITLDQPTFIQSISFEEIELYGNFGSGGQVFVDGNQVTPTNAIGAYPYNSGTAETTPRTDDFPIGVAGKSIVIQVDDITSSSEIFIDDLSVALGPPSPFVDASFSSTTGGVVPLTFENEQILPEPGGQILAIGHQGSSGSNTSQGVLEQLNSDGTTDTTFGAAGLVTTPAGNNDTFQSAALESNGQIVAVGGSNGDFLVARYNSDGSLDTTFAANGFATASFGADGAAVAASVAIDASGNIMIGGEAGNVFALARFTANGSLDPTFNPGGADDPAFPSGGQRTISTVSAGTVQQILIDGSGQILGVGADGANVAVFRLNPDASSDSTFGSSGVATITQLSSADPNSQTPVTEGIALQPGGEILVAGENPSGGLAAVRLTPAGRLDSTFGVGGISIANFGGSDDDTTGIAADPSNGQFLLVGTTNGSNQLALAVAAFNPDGTVNASFANNGQFILPGAGVLSSQSLAPQALTPPSSRPLAFHPQSIDFAFAAFGGDEKPLVGASGASSGNLIRFNSISPGTNFGRIGRKNVKLPAFTLANGTNVTLSSVGGSGTAYHTGNEVTLDLTGATSVTIKTRGGSDSLSLSGVTSTGILHALSAPTAILAGKLTAPGTIGMLKLASITGVVIAGGISNLAAGSLSGSVSCAGILATARIGMVTGTIAAAVIRSLSAGSMSGATILAGVNLGTDGEIGGSGTAADSYGAGQILMLSVTGSIANSFIGAGVNAVDGIFGDGDDISAGAGTIRSLTVKGGVDQTTRFEATTFPKAVHFPVKIVTAGDSRFIIL